MTREEFVLQRMREDYDMYKKICVIDVVCVVGFIALFVAGLVFGKLEFHIGNILIMIAVALQLPAMFKMRDSYGAALKELEILAADPTYTLSDSTYQAIESLVQSSSQLRQQVIAYSIITVALAAGAVVVLLIAGDEPVLIAAGIALVVMAVVLGFLSIRAYRALKVAKELEANNQ
ncbi:MAG: hypothetical protein IKE22_13740 [Atopobiaceae bacterium]|nr:hypothetical protein [Atopobiaceae bacterium]